MDPVRTIKLSAPATAGFWEIPVLFLDEHLLALEKPVGLPVTAGPEPAAAPGPALLPLLHDGIKAGKPWARELGLSFLANVSRLDAEAGGVLLFARSRETLVPLNDLFGSGKPTLRFEALAQGNPAWEEFDQEAPLRTQPDSTGRYHVNPRGGKRSFTRFRVLERFGTHTLMECEPLTHRAHQVRAHLARLGFPLAGDDLYGGTPLLLSRIKPRFNRKPGQAERPLLGRPALHAVALNIPHPASGEPLSVTSPLPHDFEAALKYLRRHAAGSASA